MRETSPQIDSIAAAPWQMLQEHQDALHGCRFCPMCKPAGEVANLTLLESHSTRARAMMLWRLMDEEAVPSRRQIEILYQSTLDSISQAWCVSHYAVSEYVAAARAEVYKAGLAPEPVYAALSKMAPAPAQLRSSVILLGGEAAEAGDEQALDLGARLLREAYPEVEAVSILSGALAYSLGAREIAWRQGEEVADYVRRSGANTVVADGPQTLWALQRMYPRLGIAWPSNARVTSLPEQLGALALPSHAGRRGFFHDSRSACLLADSWPSGRVIQPGYRGPEQELGQGEVFEAPRRILDSMGMTRPFTVWSRCLARTSGADDGLWQTYPDLAEGLAKQRLSQIKRLNVDLIVTDSLLSARLLARYAGEVDIPVAWLPEILADADESRPSD